MELGGWEKMGFFWRALAGGFGIRGMLSRQCPKCKRYFWNNLGDFEFPISEEG
jgi:hypothetical protein